MEPEPNVSSATSRSPAGAVLRVGLTGNIGAGKTVVGRVLAAGGCLVLDADLLAREVLGPGGAAFQEIVATFGRDVLNDDDDIDRRRLAEVAFADDESRRRLEEITHPRIRELEAERVREWAGSAGGIAVTEAALLVETGGEARYHRLVVVIAPRETRRQRLLERGHDAADIDRRMRAQLPQARKIAAADYVIDNGGPLQATRAAARELLDVLRADHDALAGDRPLTDPSR